MFNSNLDLSEERNANFPDMDISFYISNVIALLKTELNRNMISKTTHDIELKQLEAELLRKNTEMKKLKDDENSALVQMMNYKEESHRLTNRLRVLQSEIDKMNNLSRAHTRSEDQQHQNDIDELEDKLKNMQKQYNDLTQENANLRSEMKTFSIFNEEKQNERG